MGNRNGRWTVLSALSAGLLIQVTGAQVDAAPTLTTIYQFDYGGRLPIGGLLLDSAGNLYGTTYYGGANSLGSVYELSGTTHTYTTLASFGGATGAYPMGALIADSNGNLYGTTAGTGNSGSGSLGTLFQVAAGTNALTILTTFTGSNGSSPQAGLVTDSAGNMYGTTAGSAFGISGTIFKVAANTHAVATLATVGVDPVSRLALDSVGNLYGTTAEGGSSGDGTVFECSAGNFAVTTLANFTGTANGAKPFAGLTLDAAGNLYGTTGSGGANNLGTVYEIDAKTHVLTTIVSFAGGTGGKNPQCDLLIDAAGNLFGTTVTGGTNNDGTVFEIDAVTHSLTTLAQLSPIQGVPGFGALPMAGLIADANGNLFGTTRAGGALSDGTIYEITNSGFVTAPEPTCVAGLAGAAVAFKSMGRRRRRIDAEQNRIRD